MEHKGVTIKVEESPRFTEGEGNVLPAVGKKLVYRATTRFGRSYAGTPGEAVEGAKHMIDQEVGGK